MVILLDLNYTLVANSAELSPKPLEVRKQTERYRQWLLNVIKALQPEAIVLITIRGKEHEDWTLKNIASQCNGWQPDYSLFCDLPSHTRPEAWKEHALKTYVFPMYGTDGSKYLSVESNLNTHAMYERYGINGLKAFPSSEGSRKHRSPRQPPEQPQRQLFD